MHGFPVLSDDTVESLAAGARSAERVYEDAGALVAQGVPWQAAWECPIEHLAAFQRAHAAETRRLAVEAARG